jgi:hypothetical protein
MKCPTEVIQDIYSYLRPIEFNAARHTCRAWFFAGFSRSMLEKMLRRGGWYGSVCRIPRPVVACAYAEPPNLHHERIMGKWLTRECALSAEASGTFVQVGYVDFTGLVPGGKMGEMPETVWGGLAYAVSQCGEFLIVTRDTCVYIYELNHTCQHGEDQQQCLPRGSLRPVCVVVCPRIVLSCSMDTSTGRSDVAILMEGRAAIVCGIQPERLGACIDSISDNSWTESGPESATDLCVCQRYPVTQAPRIETGGWWTYRNVCHEDDPPRSIALGPQQDSVAFGCSSGIELHRAVRGWRQDFSRSLPLSSPSDYLYFLPTGGAAGMGRKLRLVSSSAAWGGPMQPLDRGVQGFHARIMEAQQTGSGVSDDVQTTTNSLRPLSNNVEVVQQVAANEYLSIRDSFGDRVSAFSADHYRAIPLSDGRHILFTDPRTGSLCLGLDAPAGSSTTLLRKVWFSPPPNATSPIPILYAAGSDTRHGVRVVATFAAVDPDDAEDGPRASDPLKTDSQIVVFYTIPADTFHGISRIGIPHHLRNHHSRPGRWFSE